VRDLQKKFLAASFTSKGTKLHDLFKRFDRNHSGGLNFDEFSRAVRVEGRTPEWKMGEGMLRALFASLVSELGAEPHDEISVAQCAYFVQHEWSPEMTPKPEPEPEPEATLGPESSAVVEHTLSHASKWRDISWACWAGANASCPTLLPQWLTFSEFVRFLLIFQSNAWSLAGGVPLVEGTTGGTALFRLGSKFNHSCDPNVRDRQHLPPFSRRWKHWILRYMLATV
jgi:hypothetical protein